MIKIERSVVINRPISEVFAFVTNFENEPQWNPGVMQTKQTSGGPIGLGTTFQEDVKVMGRRTRGAYEVIEYEPPQKFSIKSTSGPLAFKVKYSFVSLGDSTQFTGAGEIQPSGIFKVVAPLLARVVGRQIETGLVNLKRILETKA